MSAHDDFEVEADSSTSSVGAGYKPNNDMRRTSGMRHQPKKVVFDDPTDETLKREVEDQRNTFLENVKMWHEIEHPLSVLIVGLPGVGKSSFINTIAAALSGGYMELRMIGGGTRESVSPFLTVMKKCGLFDQMKIKKINAICKYPIPTLIDVPGLPEREWPDLGLIEGIRAMLYGRIKDRTKIVGKNGLVEMAEEDIRSDFPYTQCDEKMMPDIVFVVVSATRELPESLIRGIMEAVQPLDDQSYQRSFQVFGVITKVDQMDQETEEYKSKRERFIHLLNMEGREWALLETANYVNVPPGETVPVIDIGILKFLSKVAAPGVRTERGHEDEIRKFQKEESFSGQLPKILKKASTEVAENKNNKTLIIAMGVLLTVVFMKINPLIGAICFGILVIFCMFH